MNFLIYDALVTTDDKGQIRPMLAERWEVSPDGTEYTFYLRKDVKFHSGRKFTAKDVKAHFDNWQKMPTAGKIKALDSTTIVDEYTVRFKLKYPTLVFLNMISQSEWAYASIPDSEAVAKYGKDYGILPESISGTGPFKVKEWVRDDRIVLERNPDYVWGPEPYANKGPAKIDKLVIRTIPEAASRTAELKTGGIDMDIDVAPKDAPELAKTPGIVLFTAPKITANHIGFNMTKPLLQDVRIRKAIAHAVNQQQIIDHVWNGYADFAYGLWHERIEGHTPVEEMKKYYHEYDLEKAKRLLDEAGWKPGPDGIRVKDGKPLRLSAYIYTKFMEQMMQVVQADLRKIGVDLEIRELEYAAWRKALEQGEHDLRYVDGTHSTADFAYWFISSSIPYPNTLHLRDETIDKLFEITQKTMDREERVRAFQQIEQRLVGEAFVIPMPHARWLIAMRDYVKDTRFDPIHGIHKLLDTRVEKK
jgi:peptide/nickel transport system substrate-binding protein